MANRLIAQYRSIDFNFKDFIFSHCLAKIGHMTRRMNFVGTSNFFNLDASIEESSLTFNVDTVRPLKIPTDYGLTGLIKKQLVQKINSSINK